MSRTIKVSDNHVKFARFVLLAVIKKKQKHGQFHFVFRSMYNKTIIRFVFCNIENNQGLGKCYHPKPKADLDHSGYHKN